MYYDQFINLGNYIQKEEFVSFRNFGNVAKKAVPKVTNVAKKAVPKVTNVAKKGTGVAKKGAGVGVGAIGAGLAYTVKNPKTVAKAAVATGVVTYVAADQGLLGDDAQQYADDLGEAAEDNAENVGNSLKKGMGKVTDAAENMLLKKVNEVSNKYFKCDIDTLFIIICICVFLISLYMKNPVPFVLSLIGGGAVAINKYKYVLLNYFKFIK